MLVPLDWIELLLPVDEEVMRLLLPADDDVLPMTTGNSGVLITSGLADDKFDWLDGLEIDWDGERPALPIVECPKEFTDGVWGYW